jgi:hypothetical protein
MRREIPMFSAPRYFVGKRLPRNYRSLFYSTDEALIADHLLS